MRTVFLDLATLGDGIELNALERIATPLTLHELTAPDEMLARCENQQAVITNKCRFDRELLRQLPTLEYIGLTATGSDGIELEAAKDHGVAVTNITAYCTQSVLQHVFAVMLGLTHHIDEYHRDVMAGRWQQQDNFCLFGHPIRELSGRTLGIVGYGELGRAVARVGEAFGMRVAIAQRDASDDRPGRVPLDALLAQSDVVSLHCPLTDDTRHLIDAEALSQMKNDALLINTARGGLVDAAALAAALREGTIGGAAIDVLEREPPTPDNPLLDDDIPNLILTPHTAWAALQARQRAVDQAAGHLAAYVDGERSNRLV